MKHIVIFFLLFLSTLGCVARAPKTTGIPVSKLDAAVSEFRGHDGFDVVKVGRLGTAALRAVVKLGGGRDEDVRELLKIAGGINGLSVVDFEDSSDADKRAFTARIERILDDDLLIMEAKDEGDLMKIYGVVDDATGKVRDFVLYTPSDCALICFHGTIPVDTLMESFAK